jgi:uncharacterized protein (TIGR02118 family)
VQKKLGAAMKSISVEQGLGGGAPGAPMTYATMAHMLFDSLDAFQTAFAPHATEIMADIPNYSNVQPILQVSEVKL